MSRTMKPDEAICALAFLADPNEFIIKRPASKLNGTGITTITNRRTDYSNCKSNSNNDDNNNSPANDTSIQEVCIEDRIGGSFTGKIARSFARVFSEPNLFASNHSISNSSRSRPIKYNSNGNGNRIDELISSRVDDGVCFGTVEVRKYPITIGTNPSVSSGIPHTIEWDHLKEETENYDLNEYERIKPSEYRKTGDDLVLDGMTRAKMLKRLGYTKEQLLEGLRQVDEAKKSRSVDCEQRLSLSAVSR